MRLRPHLSQGARRTLSAFAPALAGCAALLAYSGGLSGAARGQWISTKDGVRVVHNVRGGQWGSAPAVSIELVRRLGDIDTADGNFAFNSPGDLAVDEAGNVYILDSGNRRIQVFGPEGRYIRTIGRKGQGPGEFSDPRSLDIDRQGRLVVLDDAQKRLQIFTPAGEVLRSVRTPSFGFGVDTMRLLGSGAMVIRTIVGFGMPGQSRGGRPSKLLKRLGPDLEIQVEFGDPVDFGDEVTNGPLNSCYFAVAGNDDIYVCLADQNRLEKYSEQGRLVWRADRELNFPAKLIRKGEQRITPTSATYIAPKFNRVAAGVAADDKGRAWVVTYGRQIRKEEIVTTVVSGNRSGETRRTEGNTDLRTTDMFKLEIFDADGVLLGAIPLTHFVDGIWIHRDRLFLLDRDRGVTYYEYRIRE
jgi:DNA-binding beta-propeller fold protein YncE